MDILTVLGFWWPRFFRSPFGFGIFLRLYSTRNLAQPLSQRWHTQALEPLPQCWRQSDHHASIRLLDFQTHVVTRHLGYFAVVMHRTQRRFQQSDGIGGYQG